MQKPTSLILFQALTREQNLQSTKIVRRRKCRMSPRVLDGLHPHPSTSSKISTRMRVDVNPFRPVATKDVWSPDSRQAGDGDEKHSSGRSYAIVCLENYLSQVGISEKFIGINVTQYLHE